jgi:hypothetical protein
MWIVVGGLFVPDCLKKKSCKLHDVLVSKISKLKIGCTLESAHQCDISSSQLCISDDLHHRGNFRSKDLTRRVMLLNHDTVRNMAPNSLPKAP